MNMGKKTVAFRTSNDLFEALPLGDIEIVLKETKSKAQSKKQELRDIVGSGYHGLIDSADAIVTMNTTIHSFKSILRTLLEPGLLHGFQGDVCADAGGDVKIQPLSEEKKVVAMLEAPVLVWEALESKLMSSIYNLC